MEAWDKDLEIRLYIRIEKEKIRFSLFVTSWIRLCKTKHTFFHQLDKIGMLMTQKTVPKRGGLKFNLT